jgi:hypothetical protein
MGVINLPAAQEYFLQSLKNVITRTNSSDVTIEIKPKLHIKSNYLNNSYINSKVVEALENVLKSLDSTYDFTNRNLPVDCCLINHPVLKTRIIEFDEAQHFSDKRLITIKKLNSYFKFHFHNDYLSLFKNPQIIESYEKAIKGRSGFISPKKGFNYKGGRISQRAFYDTLKDVAHLSQKNKSLSPIIRFSMFEFGSYNNNNFLRIPQQKIENYIENKLLKLSEEEKI